MAVAVIEALNTKAHDTTLSKCLILPFSGLLPVNLTLEALHGALPTQCQGEQPQSVLQPRSWLERYSNVHAEDEICFAVDEIHTHLRYHNNLITRFEFITHAEPKEKLTCVTM